MPLSKEEFTDWLHHPVTRALRERFAEDVERLKEGWASGEYAEKPLLDAKVRGQIEVFTQFFSLEFNDVDTE